MNSSEEKPHFRRVVITGVGLLGGSLGMALKKHNLCDMVIGVGRNTQRLEQAVAIGAIDSFSLDVEEAIRGADLVVLCGPVGNIIEMLPAVIAAADPNTLITDVGSTKETIVDAARACRRDDVFFLGSHPIAGSEKSGVAYARDDLFEGAPAILTPDLDTPAKAIATIGAMWRCLGMRVIEVLPNHHDQLLASVSHLPHLVASALVAQTEITLDEDPALLGKVAGSGFCDTTRIAMGSVPLWLDICIENRKAIGGALDNLISILIEIRQALLASDYAKIAHLLETAKRIREEI